MNRRTFLAAVGSAGAAAMAGCASTASAATGPPIVPTDRLDSGGWELVDETDEQVFEQAYAGVTVTATAKTKLYTDAQLQAEIARKTLDQANGQFATFFATRVVFSPNLTSLPAGVGREQLMDRTEQESRAAFEQRLRDAGLTNVAQTNEGSIDVATGETARLTDFAADYEFGAMSFTLPNEETVSFEGGTIGVAGHLAAWYHDGSILIAGGAYPAEDFERHVSKDVTNAITMSADIDLGLTPEQYRTELFDLMRRVE